MTPDTDTSTAVSSKDLSKRIKALTAEYHRTAKTEFAAAFKTLFAQYPRLKTISWTASEEYNDENGTDWCSTHEEPSINGRDPYDDDMDDADGENLYALAEPAEGRPADKEAKTIVKAVEGVLSSFDDDFYEHHFEYGATIDRKGAHAE